MCGYIIGFPNDTKASILHDMEVLKKELAVDLLYMNYLTPLPGSEDHRTMLNAGVWIDPDMNKYDLKHRVTHHPRMSDQEWEEAYREAHASFYSFDHMKTVIRRLVALRSNKRLTTAKLLTGYREMVMLEGAAKLEGGLFRIKNRRQRRSGLPLEKPFVFYPKCEGHQVRNLLGWPGPIGGSNASPGRSGRTRTATLTVTWRSRRWARRSNPWPSWSRPGAASRSRIAAAARRSIRPSRFRRPRRPSPSRPRP